MLQNLVMHLKQKMRQNVLMDLKQERLGHMKTIESRKEARADVEPRTEETSKNKKINRQAPGVYKSYLCSWSD